MGPVPVHLQEEVTLKHLLATTALVVAFSAPGFAQQQQQQQQGQQQPTQPAAGQEATQVQPTQGAGQEQQETGQQTTVATTSGETFLTYQEEGQIRADRVIGNTVRGADDEDIGSINDLVFDEDGRLTAAVIGVGGFLGLGQKDVAVSWDQIDWVPTGEGEEIELVTTLTKEQLEQAPEFKNLEAVQAEEEAAAAQQRMQQQGTAAPGAVPPAQQQ
jgi:PRC-barrel domain